MNDAERPSKKQRELLGFIDSFIKGHGYGPSYREVMRALDYKSVSTVAIHIENLIKKGHLLKRDRSARSLEVVASSAIHQPKVQAVSVTDEKWLVERVMKKFDEYDEDPSSQLYDQLCILTGALTVLDLTAPAAAAKARLTSLKTD